MTGLLDHTLRLPMVGELHARPFPTIAGHADARFIAMRPERRADRNHAAEWQHLVDLLVRFGATPPAEAANHWSGRLGDMHLKWESHTEVVSYLVWRRPRDEDLQLPADWLAKAPGRRLADASLRIRQIGDDVALARDIDDWFDSDSVAVSSVLDDQLRIAGDFQLYDGVMRFAVYPRHDTGAHRIGRAVQRLCEIECYRALAMLGFARSRELGPDLGRLEADLAEMTSRMSADGEPPEPTLKALLVLGGRLERLVAMSSFRFAATMAYEKIVSQRIAVLREQRLAGRQTFGEFMMRRFDPAMRTVAATERRLQALSARAEKASHLLRTRVEVDHSAENRALLQSMDRRSDQALRLQRTVEGLSVVAISYYATALTLYVAAPFAEAAGIEKTWTAALLAPLVVLCVWLGLNRVRKALH